MKNGEDSLAVLSVSEYLEVYNMELTYLDHAATSFPKPRAVGRAMMRAMTEAGGNPGRAGHPLSMRAAA